MNQEERDRIAFRAGRVFTPNSPIDEKDLFSGRQDQVRQIIEAISRKGLHVILYGERGVGKTSLANVLSSFLDIPNVFAPRVNCDSTDTFDSTWRKTLDQITYTQDTQHPGFINEPSTQNLSASILLGDQATPESVRVALQQMSNDGLPICIFDEFDRLTQEPRRAFADLIKSMSDHGMRATIILVGVADSVGELIAEHASTERALCQVQMPRMSGREIRQVLINGSKSLNMSWTDSALKQSARLAQGLPHYAHLLGLYAVRAAIESDSMEVGAASVQKAIDKAYAGASHSIRTSYENAIRSARKANLFGDVLLACALAETTDLGWFAAQDVRHWMRKITGKNYGIPTFARHLNEFCEEIRGPVLQRSGSPRLYRYRFVNPLLQPCVIMQGVAKGRISSADLD